MDLDFYYLDIRGKNNLKEIKGLMVHVRNIELKRFLSTEHLNSLPNCNFMDWTKFKAFADNNLMLLRL